MRTPLNLSLEIEIVNGLKKYSAENGVSVTRVIQEIVCQFLGLKGAIDPDLKAAVEQSIAIRPGRPIMPYEERKKREEERARIKVDIRSEQAREKTKASNLAQGLPAGGISGESENEDPETQPEDDETFGVVPDDMPQDRATDPPANEPPMGSQAVPESDIPSGPPIFKPEEHPVDKTYVGPSPLESTTERIENIVSKPHPICFRCMEVVAKCECAEGPEEG